MTTTAAEDQQANGGYGHPLQFGSFLTPANSDPARTVDLAVASEEAGLDLVTFQDHPYQPGFLDTWTLLSFVAARTRPGRPPLGPTPATSYRCHPAGALPVNDDQLFDKPILVAGQGICRQRHTINGGLLADLGQIPTHALTS